MNETRFWGFYGCETQNRHFTLNTALCSNERSSPAFGNHSKIWGSWVPNLQLHTMIIKKEEKNTTGELDAVMNCNDGGEKRGLKVSRKKKFTVIWNPIMITRIYILQAWDINRAVYAQKRGTPSTERSWKCVFSCRLRHRHHRCTFPNKNKTAEKKKKTVQISAA